tara:strand:+ start:198 stop:443 length:246 start_codon:yes stop_codon:yes gene_type:complete
MRSSLNDKDYVAFARRFVKETVDTMDTKELKDFVVNALHEDFQEVYDYSGQRGVFDDMLSWDEDVFLTVAEDFQLELEGVE